MSLEYSFVLGGRLEKAAIFIHVPEECLNNNPCVELTSSGRLMVSYEDKSLRSDPIEDEFLLETLENNKISLILINEDADKKLVCSLNKNSLGVVNFNDFK